MSPNRTREAGYTLIELLIVLVVLAVIAGIALVAVLGALDRAKQRATMSDMRSISKAIEVYAIDLGYYPSTVDIQTLKTILEPYQSSAVPTRDHWGHLYVYEHDGAGNYTIQSFGKDGIDGADISLATRADYNLDIVLANGQFVASPE